MAAKTYAQDNNVLDFYLKANSTAQTAPATVYAALFTTAPTVSGPGAGEVSGGSYARVAVTFGVPINGVVSNSATVTFPTASAGWGTVVAVGIFDAATSGNLLYFGNLGTSKTVGSGDTVSFAVGALSVTEQ